MVFLSLIYASPSDTVSPLYLFSAMVFINILSTNVRNISKIIIANSFYQIVKSIISFPTSKNIDQIIKNGCWAL